MRHGKLIWSQTLGIVSMLKYTNTMNMAVPANIYSTFNSSPLSVCTQNKQCSPVRGFPGRQSRSLCVPHFALIPSFRKAHSLCSYWDPNSLCGSESLLAPARAQEHQPRPACTGQLCLGWHSRSPERRRLRSLLNPSTQPGCHQEHSEFFGAIF